MNIGNLLNQVLGAGQQLANNNQSQGGGINLPGGLGNISSDMLKGLGGGAAATGLLSMLMGNRGGLGNTAKLGSVAAIGALAYKAYQSWQQNNTAGQSNFADIQPTHQRAPEQNEANSQIIVQAMIAAANADGRIDPNERQAILAEIGRESAEVQQWIAAQLDNPPTAQSLARAIGNDKALAAEVYLASRIVSADLDRQEIVYLHELSQALGLEDELVSHLEQQAGF